MSGHAGDAVIKDDNNGIALIVCDVYKTGDTRMNECRVAYNRYALVAAGFVGFVHAVKRGDRCAHAYAGVHHAERRHRAERVAADIAADIDLELLEGIEQTSVRASGAEHGRTRGNIYIRLEITVFFTENDLLYHALRILAQECKLLLTDNIYSDLAAVILYVGVELFNDIDFFALCGKVAEQLLGQWIEAAELEIRSLVAEGFLGVLICNSACDNADFFVVVFYLVDAEVNRFALAPCGKSLGSLLDYNVLFLCHSGHHNVFLSVFNILLEPVVDSLPYLNKAAGMGDSCCEPDYDRSVVALGNIICELCKRETFLRIRGLKHRYFGGLCIVSRILLVLRRMHTRVVRNDYDHTGIYARI